MYTNTWLEFEKDWTDLIYSNLKLLKACNQKNPHFRNVKRALNRLLRAWTDYPANYVSENCLKMFRKAKIDVASIDRRHTLILGRNKENKSKIVFEHSTPINDLIAVLINTNTLQDVNIVLKNYSGVCWITREEDDILNKNKFKNTRNGNWAKSYENCEIIPLLISELTTSKL